MNVATEQKPKRTRRDQFCVHCGFTNENSSLDLCPQCSHHTKCANCGLCNIHKDITRTGPRPEPTCEWLVQATFYLAAKQRTSKGEVRVRANGHVGALTKGFRELKRQLVKPRARVSSYQIQVTRIGASKKVQA